MPDLVQPSHLQMTRASLVSVQRYCCYTVSKCKCSQIKALESPLTYRRCSHSVVVYVSTFLAFKPITGSIFQQILLIAIFFIMACNHCQQCSLVNLGVCVYVCMYMRHRFDPWVGKIPWRRTWQPPPVFLPGESHRPVSLAGYSP